MPFEGPTKRIATWGDEKSFKHEGLSLWPANDGPMAISENQYLGHFFIIHKADLGSFWEDFPKWNHDPGFSASWKTPWLSLYFLPQLSATHGNRPWFSRANPDPTKVTRHSLRNRPCFKFKKKRSCDSLGCQKQFPESLQRADCITEVCQCTGCALYMWRCDNMKTSWLLQQWFNSD